MSLEPCGTWAERQTAVPGTAALGSFAVAAALLLLVILCGAPLAAQPSLAVLPIASARADATAPGSVVCRRERRDGSPVRPVPRPASRRAVRAPVAARPCRLPPIRAP